MTELEAKLSALRSLISEARAMPMSASCVVNRAEALSLIDAAEAAIPPPPEPAPTDAEAERLIAEAREDAAQLVSQQAVVVEAEAEAERILSEARAEAEGLQTETDTFVDQRMASFESVLHKTLDQVQVARARLAQRSGLDDDPED